MTTTPYQFVRRGNLFITPVGQSISDVSPPAQSFSRPPDFSLWVHGQIHAPGPDLDHARMSTRLYRDVRDDIVRYSPVEVTRSAFRRSNHAYVGVIDSRGTPYYFALDSRGVSVHEVSPNDDRAWKAFDRMAGAEQAEAVRQRRIAASDEMRVVDGELSGGAVVVTKGVKYGKKIDWRHDAPASHWWKRRIRMPKPRTDDRHEDDGSMSGGRVDKALPRPKQDSAAKTPSRKAASKNMGGSGNVRYGYPQDKRGGGRVPLIVAHDDTRHADPAELADQLGVSVRTLRRAAAKLGREGFAKFMRARLKRFAAKHRLDPDYWNTLYGVLASAPGAEIAKGGDDGDLKKFGDHVKLVASSVPNDHPERVSPGGDRQFNHKVFIHHVHERMVGHGMYHGDLDSFKHKLSSALRHGHIDMARADIVGPEHYASRQKSSFEHMGGIHPNVHYISEVPHDPGADKKIADIKSASKPTSSSKPAVASSKPNKVPVADSGAKHPAHAASDKAIEMSKLADHHNTKRAHFIAMEAHHAAAAAHIKRTGDYGNPVSGAHFAKYIKHQAAMKDAK